MSEPTPEIAVVVATHNRSRLLSELLESLSSQTIPTERFEVVVVDDASGDDTAAVIDAHRRRGLLRLNTTRRSAAEGPGPARDAGWRMAIAPLVAFTDDDCVATPGWLAGLLEGAERHPGAVLMGPTRPNPAQAHLRSPFSHTVHVEEAGPPYQTCNILYPRELLERIDGFDLSYKGTYTGEDTDLGWRAVQTGAECLLAPDAVVYHAISVVGPINNIRLASRWGRTAPMFKRYPELRRMQLHRGIFFSHVHEHLLLALLAAVLPRKLWPLRLLLAAPYLRRLMWRRTGPLLAPYLLAHDVIETASMIRGAIRARVLVL